MRSGAIPTRSGGRYKPATIRGYEQMLNDRVLPALGHFKLSEVTRADVQDFADSLKAEDLSPSTIQNAIDPLRVIFRRAVEAHVQAGGREQDAPQLVPIGCTRRGTPVPLC